VSDLPPPPAPSPGRQPAGPWGSPYDQASPAVQPGPPKAGFWQRFGAFFLDGLITTLFFVPAIVTMAAGPTEVEPCRVNESGDVEIFDEGPANALCEGPTNGTWAAAGVLAVAAIGATVLYFTRMVGKTGQTLGARAVGMRVVDSRTGHPIGSGRAFGRFLAASFLSPLVCYLGYLWMLWDPQRQTWHDKITSSDVIRT
jgi:uncharacterized RDD family membrane protein YckC